LFCDLISFFIYTRTVNSANFQRDGKMEQHHLDEVLLNELPNQDDFMKSIVEPADICAQYSSWESSKRIKICGTDKNTSFQEQLLIEPSSEQQILPLEIAATVPSDREEQNRSGESQSPDGEIDFITFVIGTTRMHDPSNPMPPPSRYVRKGYASQ
jgi:hypothetical protein